MTKPRLCLDYSAWMAVFNQDHPTEMVSLEAMVTAFDKGTICLLIPAVVITEIAAGPPSQLATVQSFVLRSNVEQLDITFPVGVAAGQLRAAAKAAKLKLKTPDALIVAAANYHRADFIVSVDSDICRMDGKFGLTSRIGKPNDYFKGSQPLLNP